MSEIDQPLTVERIQEILVEWDKEYIVKDGVVLRRDGTIMPTVIDHMALLTTDHDYRDKDDKKRRDEKNAEIFKKIRDTLRDKRFGGKQ